MENSRRNFLRMAAIAPVAVFAASRTATAQATACQDPASQTAAQKSLRASLEFVVVSKDPGKRCGACAFFTAKGDCGTCQILTSTVSPESVCSSFAAKSA